MSKLWLLLLLVAAFQFVHSYPSEYELDDEYMSDEVDDYLSEEEQTTMDILKDAWKKIAERLKKVRKDKLKKVIDFLNKRYCNKLEDVEEDDMESDEAQGATSTLGKLAQVMKDVYKKLKEKLSGKKEEMKQKSKEFMAKFCEKLAKVAQQNDVPEDDEGDDEERGAWNKIKGGLSKAKDKAAKKLKKVAEKAKTGMKNAAKKMKEMGFKIQPCTCEEKTCKTCISWTLVKKGSFCIHYTFMRTNKATYFILKFELGGKILHEQKIKLGNLPNCVNLGSFLGKLCCKGLEGQAKSSKGQAQANICLICVMENFSYGLKACGKYENKKFSVKLSPKTFPAAISEDGDIVTPDSNGDPIALDADEYEVD